MKLTYISKEQSLMLKGFALFVMVICHLYRDRILEDQGVFSLCSVQGVPLAQWLSGAVSPVGLYLFISGYGLYFSRKTAARGGKFRILKLYKLYWLTLLVFLPIACWLNPDRYTGGWVTALENISAFRATWNEEAWFLFPYVLLALTSKWIFATLDRWGCRKTIAACGVLYYISIFLIKMYFKSFFFHHYAVYHMAIYFDCLFMFIVGAVFCKCAEREWTGFAARTFALPQYALVILFFMVYLTACAIGHRAVLGPFFQTALILLFIRINWRGMAKKALRLLGHYSTVVWLIHTWICYYCFKPFIYSLHYPLLMLAATLAASIGIGHAIMWVDRWTTKALFAPTHSMTNNEK